MHELLRTRRRKCGAVALLMTCALTSAWMRSFSSSPSPLPRQFVFHRETCRPGIWFRRVDQTVDRFYSKDATLVWETLRANAPMMVSDLVGVWVNATDLNIPDLAPGNDAWQSHWKWCGFESRDLHLQEARYTFQLRRWTLPYWAIVVPMILLTVFLLLSKPPISPSRKLDEALPHDADGKPRSLF